MSIGCRGCPLPPMLHAPAGGGIWALAGWRQPHGRHAGMELSRVPLATVRGILSGEPKQYGRCFV